MQTGDSVMVGGFGLVGKEQRLTDGVPPVLGRRLATCLHFPGDPANDSGPFLSGLAPAQRDSLVAHSEQEGSRFDIRLQGDQQTASFAV